MPGIIQIYPQDKKWYILYVSDIQGNNFYYVVGNLLKINLKYFHLFF